MEREEIRDLILIFLNLNLLPFTLHPKNIEYGGKQSKLTKAKDDKPDVSGFHRYAGA